MNKKIVVFHPMQQHSYKTAKALINNNLLFEYWTSIYYNPKKFMYRILSKLLSKDNIKRMQGRTCEELDPYVRTYCSFWGLLFLLLGRIDKSDNKKKTYKIKDIFVKKIGKKVAKIAIKNGVDYIIAYDTWAYSLIRELKRKKSKICVIMDYSSLYAEEIVNIINDDINNNPSKKYTYSKLLEQFSPKYMEQFRFEKNNASFFLSPSSVVDCSLTSYEVKKEKIFRCTYGTYFEHLKYIQKKYDKVRFIYIGRLSYAKGVHYLINAFNNLKRNDFELLLVGNDVDGLTLQIKNENIKAIGLVQHDRIPDLLSNSDIIISASLYDGFSLAMLEGASYNLPMICTEKNGVSDYIQEGKNRIYN